MQTDKNTTENENTSIAGQVTQGTAPHGTNRFAARLKHDRKLQLILAAVLLLLLAGAVFILTNKKEPVNNSENPQDSAQNQSSEQPEVSQSI